MDGRHQIGPTSGRGVAALACLLALCAPAAAAAAAPSAPAPPSPPPAPAAPGALLPAAPDTVPDGPSSEVFGRVVEQGARTGVGQARLRFRRLVDDSVIDTFSATTTSDGAFRFQRLPSGTYALRTEHLGYESRRDTFRVPIAKSMEITVPLAAAPVALEPLRVDVRAGWLVEEGFYRRRARGLGKFLTPEELDRRPVNSLTQALKTLPGVEWARRCSSMGMCRDVLVMSLSSGRVGCEVKYYMDGAEMHGPVTPRNISVNGLAAIEVYRGISETPAEFYGRCGSVVLWSKRSGD